MLPAGWMGLRAALRRGCSSWSKKLAEGPPLESFIANSAVALNQASAVAEEFPTDVPYLSPSYAAKKNVFFEVSLSSLKIVFGFCCSKVHMYK